MSGFLIFSNDEHYASNKQNHGDGFDEKFLFFEKNIAGNDRPKNTKLADKLIKPIIYILSR